MSLIDFESADANISWMARIRRIHARSREDPPRPALPRLRQSFEPHELFLLLTPCSRPVSFPVSRHRAWPPSQCFFASHLAFLSPRSGNRRPETRNTLKNSLLWGISSSRRVLYRLRPPPHMRRLGVHLQAGFFVPDVRRTARPRPDFSGLPHRSCPKSGRRLLRPISRVRLPSRLLQRRLDERQAAAVGAVERTRKSPPLERFDRRTALIAVMSQASRHRKSSAHAVSRRVSSISAARSSRGRNRYESTMAMSRERRRNR